MKNRNVLTVCVAMLCSAAAWGQTPVESDFAAANEAYAAGDYATAIAGYEALLQDRLHFDSEYNLGNAYFKTQQWGPAILHYERALLLAPNDEDARANLTLANAQIKDRIESLPSNGFRDLWERVVAPGRLRFWVQCMIIAWTLGFLALAWRTWITGIENRRILGASAAVLLGIGLLTMAFTRAASQRVESSKSGIIMAAESAVRNEPGSNGMTLFMLHEGTKVTVIQRQAEHWKIQLANGNSGWINARDLVEI